MARLPQWRPDLAMGQTHVFLEAPSRIIRNVCFSQIPIGFCEFSSKLHKINNFVTISTFSNEK